MTDESMKKLKKMYAIKWLIFLGVASSVFVYFIIIVLIKKSSPDPLPFTNPDLANILSKVFIGISPFFLLAAFYIRRTLTDPKKFLKALKKRNLDPATVERFAGKIDDETVKKIAGAILFSNTIDIISWSLINSLSVFGLILSLLSGDVIYLQAFGAVMLFALAFSRPNFEVFISMSTEALKEGEIDT